MEPIYITELGDVFKCDAWPACKEAGCTKIDAVRKEMGCETPELNEGVVRAILTAMAFESYSTKIDVLDTPSCAKLCEYIEWNLRTTQENALCVIRGFFGFMSGVATSPFYPAKARTK